MFLKMFGGEESLGLDVVILVIIMLVCVAEVDIEMGVMVYGMLVKLGFIYEVMVNNVLFDMYVKCGFLYEVKIMFEKNENKNVVLWNFMIWNFFREGDVLRVFDFLREM